MKEENEPEEVRPAGYVAIAVRRLRSDYSHSEHSATLGAGSRTPVFKRLSRWIAEVWHFVQNRSSREPAPRTKERTLTPKKISKP